MIWISANFKGLGKIRPGSKKVHFNPAPQGVNVVSVQAVEDSLLITSPRRIFIAPIGADDSRIFERELTGEIFGLIKDIQPYFRKAGKLSNGKVVIIRASKLENQYPIIETPRYFLAEGYDFFGVGGRQYSAGYGIRLENIQSRICRLLPLWREIGHPAGVCADEG
ncbi:hypothetical protein [Algoriphagus boritolerans]|uniref:hypothetical protein n=1 Tax=Algoriphagus boritolerans TaxID=308111 RepID=UPI000A4D438A